MRGFFSGGPPRPLELLDPEAEHSRFSPHCRPDGAPNHTALLLRLPEFNRNPQVTRPKRSLLGEQTRGRWEGGWRLKAFVEEKTHVCSHVWWLNAAVVAECCSGCSPHIYGWVLVSVFFKFLFFFKQLHIMRKFLQSTTSRVRVRVRVRFRVRG